VISIDSVKVQFLRIDCQGLIKPGLVNLVAAYDSIPPLMGCLMDQNHFEGFGDSAIDTRPDHNQARIFHAARIVGSHNGITIVRV